jgi:hypothetical protein
MRTQRRFLVLVSILLTVIVVGILFIILMVVDNKYRQWLGDSTVDVMGTSPAKATAVSMTMTANWWTATPEFTGSP